MGRAAVVLGLALSCFAPLACAANEEFRIGDSVGKSYGSTSDSATIRARARVLTRTRRPATNHRIIVPEAPSHYIYVPVPHRRAVRHAKPVMGHRPMTKRKTAVRHKPTHTRVSKAYRAAALKPSRPVRRGRSVASEQRAIRRSAPGPAVDAGVRKAVRDLRTELHQYEKRVGRDYVDKTWLNNQGFVKRTNVGKEVGKALDTAGAKLQKRWRLNLMWGAIAFVLAFVIAMLLLAAPITVVILRVAAAIIFALIAAMIIYLLLSLIL